MAENELNPASPDGNPVRVLADELHSRWMAAEPFAATDLGATGYDALVPDVSADAALRLRADAVSVLDRVDRLPVTDMSPADRITLAAVRDTGSRLVSQVDAATIEFTVSTMGEGPSELIGVAARTRLAGPAAARDYLDRVGGFAAYLDSCAARLDEGAAAGRLPVAALVAVVRDQVRGYLEAAGNDPVSGVDPPEGWDGAPAWQERLDRLVKDEVRPAFARYEDTLAALADRARPDEHCGLAHLPGGEKIYARLVEVHTTLPLTAWEVHATGLAAIEELTSRMTELGGGIGLDGFPAVLTAARASSLERSPAQAIEVARRVVAAAEARLGEVIAPPLPPPCEVQAMSDHLGRAGLPPHYTPPSPDGARRGTYWFNTVMSGAGTGWDLEAVTYHEAVPGHHLQLARHGLHTDLPTLQTQNIVTAHAEGWGLYAELLAGEMGLYQGVRSELGALGVQAFRAGRLVVDTGIHALGWDRRRAIDWFVAHVPLPEPMLISEINRYVGMPGQALAYWTGQSEILRLRAMARAGLGERFDLRGFHGAVLDSGELPLPAVGMAVELWIEQVAAASGRPGGGLG